MSATGASMGKIQPGAFSICLNVVGVVHTSVMLEKMLLVSDESALF